LYGSFFPHGSRALSKTHKSAATPGLEFSGERFVPECEREMRYEHWHRYAFAGNLVAGLTVLDAACGEGYGTGHLSRHAALAVGLDLAAEAVAHAGDRYGSANAVFVAGDCTRLPLGDNSVEAVVSFETIEHLDVQREMLAEFRRVLTPDGFMVLSSPNRKTYSDDTGYDNPHHVRELYREELLELLAEQFGAVRLLAQKLMFHSVIWDAGKSTEVHLDTLGEGGCRNETRPPVEPLYYIALCADTEAQLPDLHAGLWLFDDAQESVYAHYGDEVRRNIHSRKVLEAYDQQLRELQGANKKANE